MSGTIVPIVHFPLPELTYTFEQTTLPNWGNQLDLEKLQMKFEVFLPTLE